MRTCPKCKTRVKDWNGSDPKCGFPDGIFSSDNWNCATLNALRDLCDADGSRGCRTSAVYSEDQWAALLPYDGNFVLVTWYKRRGRTEGCYLVTDQSVRPITLKEAEEVLASQSPGGVK